MGIYYWYLYTTKRKTKRWTCFCSEHKPSRVPNGWKLEQRIRAPDDRLAEDLFPSYFQNHLDLYIAPGFLRFVFPPHHYYPFQGPSWNFGLLTQNPKARTKTIQIELNVTLECSKCGNKMEVGLGTGTFIITGQIAPWDVELQDFKPHYLPSKVKHPRTFTILLIQYMNAIFRLSTDSGMLIKYQRKL